MSTRLAAAETPLAFVALWTLWAPLYAGALVAELVRGPVAGKLASPQLGARPFFSARFREIAPGLVDARRANASRRGRRADASR